MTGMIKRELLMLKGNYKMFIIAFGLYVSYTFLFDMNMSFLLPFMGLMVCISLFTYDDFNNWHSYATTLPNGKKNVVKARYFISIFLILIMSLICILFSFILSSFKTNFSFDFSGFLGCVFSIIVMMSILYPFLFKFGAEKGRIIMMCFGFIVFGIFILLSKVFSIQIPVNLLLFFDKYLLLIVISLSVIFIGVSYIVSKKIYFKREF